MRLRIATNSSLYYTILPYCSLLYSVILITSTHPIGNCISLLCVWLFCCLLSCLRHELCITLQWFSYMHMHACCLHVFQYVCIMQSCMNMNQLNISQHFPPINKSNMKWLFNIKGYGPPGARKRTVQFHTTPLSILMKNSSIFLPPRWRGERVWEKEGGGERNEQVTNLILFQKRCEYFTHPASFNIS